MDPSARTFRTCPKVLSMACRVGVSRLHRKSNVDAQRLAGGATPTITWHPSGYPSFECLLMALSGLSPKYTRDVQSKTVSVTSGPYSLKNLCLNAVIISSLFLPRSSTARYKRMHHELMAPQDDEIVPGFVRNHGLSELGQVCALGLERANRPVKAEAFKERRAQTRLPMGTD